MTNIELPGYNFEEIGSYEADPGTKMAAVQAIEDDEHLSFLHWHDAIMSADASPTPELLLIRWIARNTRYTRDERITQFEEIRTRDKWLKPSQTLTIRKGDCEDKAILFLAGCYHIQPKWEYAVLVVWSEDIGEYHALGAVQSNEGLACRFYDHRFGYLKEWEEFDGDYTPKLLYTPSLTLYRARQAVTAKSRPAPSFIPADPDEVPESESKLPTEDLEGMNIHGDAETSET